jgi:hypothetical protein
MKAKWLNIYDYGEGYIYGSDLYNNPIKATRDLADKEHYKHTINIENGRIVVMNVYKVVPDYVLSEDNNR